MTKTNEHGYTLLEVVLVSTMIVPLLGALIATTRVVSGSVAANEEAAEVDTSMNRSFDRVAQILRGAYLSTVRVKTTEAEAKDSLNKAGDWHSPGTIEERQSLQIRVARSGVNDAHRIVQTRAIEFVRDPREKQNGIDDDGDGMIDEGRIVLTYGNDSLVLARGVEDFAFDLEGRLLRVRLRCARKDESGRIYRSSFRRNILIRNR